MNDVYWSSTLSRWVDYTWHAELAADKVHVESVFGRERVRTVLDLSQCEPELVRELACIPEHRGRRFVAILLGTLITTGLVGLLLATLVARVLGLPQVAPLVMFAAYISCFVLVIRMIRRTSKVRHRRLAGFRRRVDGQFYFALGSTDSFPMDDVEVIVAVRRARRWSTCMPAEPDDVFANFVAEVSAAIQRLHSCQTGIIDMSRQPE